jgi:uncharacterized membrane protein
MPSSSAKRITACAMIAALYFALGLLFLPITYGPVQVRVAEALTLLPIFSPWGVVGVILGCAVTNAYGVAAGANILGALDIFIGTGATLAAALMTRGLRHVRIKGIPILAPLPPVLVNALVIGGELTFVMAGGWDARLFALNALQVGAGQFVSCYVLGLVLVYALEKAGLHKKLF